MECPTCDRSDFSSERGMKSHHKRQHGESIAGVLVECPICGDSFREKQCRIDEMETEPTCSYECKAESERKGEYVFCEFCDDKFYRQPYFVENRSEHYCSHQCLYNNQKGEENPNWGGGTDNFFDNTPGRAWRRAVFERDNFTCQDCGDGSGGNLNAHHIKRRSNCNNLEKYCIWNGVTVCEKCHAERHEGDNVYEMLLQIAES